MHGLFRPLHADCARAWRDPGLDLRSHSLARHVAAGPRRRSARVSPADTSERHPPGLGSPDDGWLIEQLAAGFRQFQPGVRFKTSLHGPESTFAAVYMDVADIGFMAREIRVPLETMGFEWATTISFEVAIANAGLGADHGMARPAVDLGVLRQQHQSAFVRDLATARRHFAADHRRGGRNVRRWGELRLGGAWTGRPIHIYGPALTNTSVVFVRQSVLDGSRKWNPDYRPAPGGWSEVLETLARDPDGISFAPPLPGNQGVKALRLAATSQSRCYPLTARTAAARAYPLPRMVDAALDRAPGAPIKPETKEFLALHPSAVRDSASSSTTAHTCRSAPQTCSSSCAACNESRSSPHSAAGLGAGRRGCDAGQGLATALPGTWRAYRYHPHLGAWRLRQQA